jgi:hypothetical protein
MKSMKPKPKPKGREAKTSSTKAAVAPKRENDGVPAAEPVAVSTSAAEAAPAVFIRRFRRGRWTLMQASH